MNQTNNPFGNLSTEGLEKSGDVLGGARIFDTDVYTGTIKLAFTGKSDGGAHFMEVHVDIGDNRIFQERLWVKGKSGNHYYEKNGKKYPLPGFTTANDLALLATGFDLGGQTYEEKVVKLYDYDAKAELPKSVLAVTSLMGKEVSLGLLRQTVDKNKKDESTGEYVPSGETRDENIIDKVFHAETGKTVSEYSTNVETAEFKGKWLEKNKGKVVMKAKGAEGKSGAPGAPSAGGAPGGAKTPTKSLFG